MLLIARPMNFQIRNRQFKQILILTVTLLVLASVAWGAQIKLAWNSNNNPQVTGYKVYCGTTSGKYTTTINVGSRTAYTVSNLAIGKTYFFAVTAYAAGNNESKYSNEIAYTVPAAPTLSSVTVTGPTQLAANSSAQFTCIARYSDATTATVTDSATWSVTSGSASIDAKGYLTIGAVQANEQVAVTASLDGKKSVHYLTLTSLSTNGFSASGTTDNDLAGSSTNAKGTCALTIDIGGAGNVLLDPPGGSYEKGTVVTLTAKADPAWAFDGWEGVVSDNASEVTSVLMDGDLNVAVNFLEDADSDSVPDQEEWGPDSLNPDFDGNGDGIADCLQDNVVSMHTKDYQQYLTISVMEPARFSTCKPLDPSSLANAPAKDALPFGLFSYKIENVDTGVSIPLTIYLPTVSNYDTFYKYGPTADNSKAHWYEFTYDQDSDTGAILEDGLVTLYLRDGQRGDDDLKENRSITDAGGPALSTANQSSDSLSEDTNGPRVTRFNTGSGCFLTSIFNN
jgi:Divergent InlB B-repeat domain/Fibronectin type III domain